MIHRDFNSPSIGIKSLLCKTKFRTLILILWLFFFVFCGYYLYFISYIQNVKEKQVDISTPPLVNNDDTNILLDNHPYEGATPSYTIPILIFTFKRPDYLKQTIDTLLEHMPRSGFDLLISQDGYEEAVTNVIKSYGSKIKQHFQRERKIIMTDKNPNFLSYYAIAQHYKFGIENVFKFDKNYDRVIILEEDLQVSIDFFDYFSRMSPLLDRDSSLFCISAWNDNGMNGLVHDPSKFYRSDFFPGLGWMTTRKLWEQDFGPKWPIGFWDDWIREGQNRKGRACIRPEISRTFTFGSKGGASSNQFSHFLSNIKLNNEKIDWDHFDIDSLTKKNYDKTFIEEIKSATLISDMRELFNKERTNERIRLIYSSSEEFLSIAKQLGIMDDIKAGVPRGAYLGTITIKWRSNTLHITTQSLDPITYSNSPPFKL